MGLLKHVVLPLLALMHSWMALTTIFGDRSSIPIKLDWPPSSSEELTPYELHALGIIGGFELAFAFGAIMGIVRENSHFRAVFTTMELVLWLYRAIDANSLGFPYVFVYAMSALSAIGLAVHMNEPGIFTKDKRKKKTG